MDTRLLIYNLIVVVLAEPVLLEKIDKILRVCQLIGNISIVWVRRYLGSNWICVVRTKLFKLGGKQWRSPCVVNFWFRHLTENCLLVFISLDLIVNLKLAFLRLIITWLQWIQFNYTKTFLLLNQIRLKIIRTFSWQYFLLFLLKNLFFQKIISFLSLPPIFFWFIVFIALFSLLWTSFNLKYYSI